MKRSADLPATSAPASRLDIDQGAAAAGVHPCLAALAFAAAPAMPQSRYSALKPFAYPGKLRALRSGRLAAPVHIRLNSPLIKWLFPALTPR